MSLKDFNINLNFLSSVGDEIQNELIQLFTTVNSLTTGVDKVSISDECLNYLLYNLQKTPYPTVQLIQKLLCLWNLHFKKTDSILQNLFITALDLLLSRFNNNADGDLDMLSKILCILSQLELTDEKIIQFKTEIIPKLDTFIKRLKLRNLLYLSLMFQNNSQHLKSLFECDVKNIKSNLENSSDLFVQVQQNKTHWLAILINTTNISGIFSSQFEQIVNFIKLMILTNEFDKIKQIIEYLNFVNREWLDPFLYVCCTEMYRQTNLIKFCSENNIRKMSNINTIIEFARNNSCLATIARFVDICESTVWNKCMRIIEMDTNFLTEFYGEKNINNWDIALFRAYIIMINVIQCIAVTNMNSVEDYLKITSRLSEIKHDILNLECIDLRIELVENIFALIFLRYEHYSEESNQKVYLSGFVCNALILRDVLNMLKYCIYEIENMNNNNSRETPIINIKNYVTEALRRLYFLTTDEFFLNVGNYSNSPKITYCRCDESSSNNIQHYYCIECVSSDSDNGSESKMPTSLQTSVEENFNVKDNFSTLSEFTNHQNLLLDMSTTVRNSSTDEKSRKFLRSKRGVKQKSETEQRSSGGSETTVSSGKSYKKQPKRSTNCDAMRERNFLLNFMFASPQSLICLCLAQHDYERVQQVIKMYDLENSHLASNVLFIRNLQELRIKLDKLFEKSNLDKLNNKQISNEQLSLVQNIKNITGSAYDKTQVINVIEQFFSLNLLPENHDSKSIIEQYASVFPFLNNYSFKNEIFMQVFDICITLGVTSEHSLTLLKCACRHAHHFENNSNFSILFENIHRIYQENSVQSQCEVSLPNLLTDCKYPLSSKYLIKKMVSLNNLQSNYDQFYNTDDQINIFCEMIKNINDYFKSLELSVNVNYIQRLQTYFVLFTKIFSVFEQNKFGKNFDLINMKRSETIDQFVTGFNIEFEKFEDIFLETNLDFIYHLITTCSPKIQFKVESEILLPVSDNFELFEIFGKIKQLLGKTPTYIWKEHVPNEFLLRYINKNNPILAHILVTMYPESNVNQVVDTDSKIYTCLDNMVNLQSINCINVLYNNNSIVAALQNLIDSKLCEYIFKQMPLNEISQIEELFRVITNLSERQLINNTNVAHLKYSIIKHIVENNSSHDDFKLIEQIKNLPLQINLVLKYLKYWPGFECIRILKELLSNFEMENDSELKKTLHDWLNKIIVYEQVRVNSRFNSWYDVYMASVDSDSNQVLQSLIKNEMIESAINWLQYHKLNKNAHELITTEFLKLMLDKEHCNLCIFENILNQMPLEQTQELCRVLLKLTRNLKQLEFIINYILNRDKSSYDLFHNVNIGIKLLINIKPNKYEEMLWSLTEEPLLILEHFILNTRFEKLSQLIKVIRPLLPENHEYLISHSSIDGLLRMYAEKALEFRVQLSIASTNQSTISIDSSVINKSNECRLLQSIDSVSTSVSETVSFTMPEHPPLKSDWMQDYKTTVCLCCNETVFSMFNRRHHCRRCGRVVCGLCSNKRLKISHYGDILVRICNQCFILTIQQQNQEQMNYEKIISSGISISTDRFGSETYVDFWQLTDDPVHNNTIREEFSFEYAPSVSLCLSILKLHSQNELYPKFLLNQCNTILRLIIPSKMKTFHHEIDYNMIIQMLRSLLLAAKVSCDHNSYDSKLIYCDELLGQVDILKILAVNDCLDLLFNVYSSTEDNYKLGMTPLSGLDLRKLRDNLMESEKWNLALEVTTKGGLDTIGLFAVWGKACLKAGCFQQAREKFQYCLERVREEDVEISSENENKEKSYLSTFSMSSIAVRPNKNPSLVNEIIQILESFTYDHFVLQKVTSANNVSKISQNSSAINIGINDPAVNIISRLTNLKNIIHTNYGVKRKNSKVQNLINSNTGNQLDQYIFNECLYYLQLYGSHSGIIEFYLHHNRLNDVILYLANHQLENEYYVDLYVYCLKNGFITQLQDAFIKIDSSLVLWKNGLKYVCRHLEQNGFLNILYQIQEWLGDNVRASMTCIKFFQMNASNYTDLLANLEHLYTAQDHLKMELENDYQWVQIDKVNKDYLMEKTLVLKIDSKEIDKHINTIWRQMEVTKFLAANEKAGRKTMQLLFDMFKFTNDDCFPENITVPSLFGSKLEKIQLAVLTIISGENVSEGFGLAFRIIQDFQLNASKIYCIVAKQLAKNGNCAGIEMLVENINTSGISTGNSTLICDEVLAMAVRTLNEQANCSPLQIESLIKLIQDVNIKISAYIESKQLKFAYLLAVRYDNVRDIRRIMREAEKLNQTHIKNICAKRLLQTKNK